MKHRARLIRPELIMGILLGCHRSAIPEDLPAALRSGETLYAYAPPGLDCAVSAAAKPAMLRDGEGSALSGLDQFRQPVPLRVGSAEAEGGWLLVRAEAPDQSSIALHVPAGQTHACLSTDPGPVEEAVGRVGKSFVYTPWLPTCKSIQAVGQASSALLIESEPGVTFQAERVLLGSGQPGELSAPAPGDVLWYAMKEGIFLRADTLARCFTEQCGSGECSEAAIQEPGLADLLRTPLSRCVGERDAHVECRTTLGVWAGVVSPSAVSLSRRRRTLGALHFFAGRPVAAGRFARTLVAFQVESSDDPHVGELSRTFVDGIRAALTRQSEGDIRLAGTGEASTHQVALRVANLSIGPLRERTVREVTRYKSGERTNENPEKEEVENRVLEAAERLRDAEREYEEEKERIEEQNEAAIRACNEQKEKATGNTRAVAELACSAGEFGLSFREADKSMLASARDELFQARQQAASTPATITEDIMSDWTYDKRIYEREASATLELVYSSSGGQRRSESIPFHEIWSDWEVEPDPAHGVTGHRADRAPIANADAVLAPIGSRMSREIAARLTTELQQATLDQARAAFLAAGKSRAKPGYEDVDAEAFDVAGARLARVKLRSRVLLAPGKPVVLPTRAVRLAAGECVLAVAVSERGQPALRLSLGTAEQRHGDVRGAAKAVFEACPGDFGSDVVPRLALEVAGTGGAVRWALYTTRVTALAGGGAP